MQALAHVHIYYPLVMSDASSYSCSLFLQLQVVDKGATTNMAEIEAWMQNDVDARTYIYSTIKAEQQCSLHGCSTAHAMWSRIQTVHAQVVADNEHLITAKFFNYKYQPGHSVMSHVAAIEQMVAHLKGLNGPISEVQVMSKILQTLPPSYRHFLSAWDNVPRDVNSIKLLTPRLVQEETRTKQYNNGGSDQAFFAGSLPQSTQSTNSMPLAFPARGYQGRREHFCGRGTNRGGRV